MKTKFFFLFISLFAVACATKGGGPLDAKSFSEKFKSTPNAVLLDVRTAGEFDKEYIDGAMLADWNSSDFKRRVEALDKANPVFVYCLSGGRSASAAKYLRDNGYDVYELQGGIMKWKAAGLPTVSNAAKKEAGMTQEQYTAATSTGKVLVDFNAEWCAPCKRLHPILDELVKEDPTLKLVSIDVDKNTSIAEIMKIEALPTVIYYVDGKPVFQNVGLLSKEELKAKMAGK